MKVCPGAGGSVEQEKLRPADPGYVGCETYLFKRKYNTKELAETYTIPICPGEGWKGVAELLTGKN